MLQRGAVMPARKFFHFSKPSPCILRSPQGKIPAAAVKSRVEEPRRARTKTPRTLNVYENTGSYWFFQEFSAVGGKAQDIENKGVASILHRLQKRRKKRMLNEGVSLNVYENRHVKKLTWIKFPPNLECCRKTSYLRVRTLNGIERKGDSRWMWG
jgi:hypothetical protein